MTVFGKIIACVVSAGVFYPLIHFLLRGLNAEDIHSLSAFLAVVGAIYSVLIAFVIFVVWDQYNAVEKATAREAAIVEDLYRLSRYFSEDPMDFRRQFAKSVKGYLMACVEEWDELSKGRESEKAIAALNNLEARLRDCQTTGESDKIIYASLIDSLKQLFEFRDERVALAKHRMPITLTRLVMLLSCVLVFGFAVLPIHSPWLGTLMVMSAVGVVVTIYEVIRDIDNPFRGLWNISPGPFVDQAKRIL